MEQRSADDPRHRGYIPASSRSRSARHHLGKGRQITADMEFLVWGVLPTIIIVSAALTLPISFFLLWLYRRAVLRGMDVRTGLDQVPGEHPSEQPVTAPGAPLTIAAVDARTVVARAPAANPVQRAAARSLRRVVAIYVLAGLASPEVRALLRLLFAMRVPAARPVRVE